MNARRGTSADALARMQRAALAPSPATRTATGDIPEPDADNQPTVAGEEAARVEPVLSPAPTSPASTAPAAGTAPAAKPTRTTLDLDRPRYLALRTYAAQHGARGAEVLRALIDQLDGDPLLARIIADRLANDRDSLR